MSGMLRFIKTSDKPKVFYDALHNLFWCVLESTDLNGEIYSVYDLLEQIAVSNNVNNARYTWRIPTSTEIDLILSYINALSTMIESIPITRSCKFNKFSKIMIALEYEVIPVLDLTEKLFSELILISDNKFQIADVKEKDEFF